MQKLINKFEKINNRILSVPFFILAYLFLYFFEKFDVPSIEIASGLLIAIGLIVIFMDEIDAKLGKWYLALFLLVAVPAAGLLLYGVVELNDGRASFVFLDEILSSKFLELPCTEMEEHLFDVSAKDRFEFYQKCRPQ